MHGTLPPTPAAHQPRSRLPLLIFFWLLIAAAYVVEIVDPAPMSVEASVSSP